MESFSLDQMIRSLVVDGFDPAGKLGWLENSYARPVDFFKAMLAAYQKDYGFVNKSCAFGHYDFYYDIFEKKQTAEAIAYIHYDATHTSHEVTYETLRQMVDTKACDWMLRGAVGGESICLVYDLGLEYAVCVLAALKIGLIHSFLSPSRPYLFNKATPGLAVDNLMPSAGLDWNLTAVVGKDDTLSEEFGMLSISTGTDIKSSPYLVVKSMYEWLLLGSCFKEKQGTGIKEHLIYC